MNILQDALGRHEERLSKQKLYEWHRALFPIRPVGRSHIKVGGFRVHEDSMQIISGRPGKEVIHFIAPPSDRVNHEVTIFLDWFNGTQPYKQIKNDSKNQFSYLDGLQRAAIAYLWFETIYPFEGW